MSKLPSKKEQSLEPTRETIRFLPKETLRELQAASSADILRDYQNAQNAQNDRNRQLQEALQSQRPIGITITTGGAGGFTIPYSSAEPLEMATLSPLSPASDIPAEALGALIKAIARKGILQGGPQVTDSDLREAEAFEMEGEVIKDEWMKYDSPNGKVKVAHIKLVRGDYKKLYALQIRDPHDNILDGAQGKTEEECWEMIKSKYQITDMKYPNYRKGEGLGEDF